MSIPDRSTLQGWAAAPGRPPADAFDADTLATLDRCMAGEDCPLEQAPASAAGPSPAAPARRRPGWVGLLLLLSAAWAMLLGRSP